MNKSTVSMVKKRRLDVGRNRRTNRVWHNILRGKDRQALLSNTGWGFSPSKASFHSLLFPLIRTQPFEEVSSLSFSGALKEHFPGQFFQSQEWGAGGGGGTFSVLDRPEQGSHLPPTACRRTGMAGWGEPFSLGTEMEDGWRFNDAISWAWSQTSQHAPN